MEVSSEFIFLLTLGLRMAITAAFVVTASVITERSGPVIGALVATLPISAGPSYVFLALDHDRGIHRRGRAGEPADQRGDDRSSALTYVGAGAASERNDQLRGGRWPCGSRSADASHAVQWSLAGGLIAQRDRLRHLRAAARALSRTWQDAADHAALVRHPVARIAGRDAGRDRWSPLSGWVGPMISGIIALFPIVFTSHDADPASAHRRPRDRRGARQRRLGTDGLSIAIAVLHLAALQFGSAVGLSLALAICVSWNLRCGATGGGSLCGDAKAPSLRGATRRSNRISGAELLRGACHRARVRATRPCNNREIPYCFGSFAFSA